MNKTLVNFLLLFLLTFYGYGQNIGISATGVMPDPKAMLDIASTTSGLLIPRMTTAQRDAIASPPVSLYIYNTTTNTFDYFNGNTWLSVSSRANGTIIVQSLADLPAPAGGAITLEKGKNYIFSGVVNISPNYINLNGAIVQGHSPLTDVILSTVAGAVLRSTGEAVHVQQITIAPGSGATQAFNFTDATGTHTCAILTGTSVRDLSTGTLGVGQITGFRDIILLNTLWDTRSGVKIGGNVGGFTFAYNIIHGITSGSAIQFVAGLNANDINISNNQFVYTTQPGITLDPGATVDFGRVIANIFRGITNYTVGFNSYSPGWEMSLNTGLPNSRSYGYLYMDGNVTTTVFPGTGTFTKVAGTTTLVTGQKFTASNNRLTYTGKRPITARVFIVIGARSPASSADYSIALAKNGSPITAPTSSLGPLANNQGFQIVLETEVSLVTNDYVEVFIRSNVISTNLTVPDLQFRVTE
jgi:hypothetical protein